MNWHSQASRVRELVFRATDALAATLVLAMVVVVVLRILDRTYSTPITGHAEIAQAMVVWVIFLGVGRAAFHRNDIRSDWVLKKVPARVERVLRTAILVVDTLTVAAIFFAALFVLLEFATRTTPAAGIPYPVIYGALLVGFGLLLLVYVSRLGRLVASAAGQYYQRLNGRADEEGV